MTNATGTALAVAVGTANLFASQTTTLNLALAGIMAAFTISVTPSTLQLGEATPITVTEHPLDAAGNTLGGAFVNTKLATPIFSTSVTDPTGVLAGSLNYSGVGSGTPITITVQSPGYAAASATLSFTPATPSGIGFALEILGYNSPTTLQEYAPASPVAVRAYGAPCGTCTGHPRFDKNGALWGYYSFGINANATSAGPFLLTGPLLSFDLSGKTYVSDPATNAVDVYSGATLIRQFNVPFSPTATAIDAVGNVFVSTNNGVYEYGPTGSGNIVPVAVNAAASFAATDAAGNVYAVVGSAVDVWPAGTFGATPGRSMLIPPLGPGPGGAAGAWYPDDLGVDAAGDIYEVQVYRHAYSPGGGVDVFYAPAGSSAFPASPLLTATSTSSQAAIAVPLRM